VVASVSIPEEQDESTLESLDRAIKSRRGRPRRIPRKKPGAGRKQTISGLIDPSRQLVLTNRAALLDHVELFESFP
jgi:hypothetical protein